MRRALFLIHRWLGIGIALLMLVWAASGIVMMYVAFPETSEEERLAGLQPLDLSQCCDTEAIHDPALARDLRVEMLTGHPALRWTGEQGPQMASLDGSQLPEIGQREALGIAGTYMERTTGAVPEARVALTGTDQWTVYGSLRQHRPLYKIDFADEAGTTLYVSGMSGTVVQDTTAHERFWNWLGAVPHWLYFTAFRTQQALWSNFVIYSSLLGVFLTVTGIYVGIRQFGRGKGRSPYRGLALWHHWTGLVFGAVTLTWIVSGLFSMQPWGWFESDGPGEELAAVARRGANGEDLASFVQALKQHAGPDVVSAELSMQDGDAYAILARPGGEKTRADLDGLTESPLSVADLERRARRAKPGTPIAEMGMIEGPDAYHYAHKDERIALPAFRIIYGDEQRIRLYFDPRTGGLVGYADAPRRAYRWLHYGLHRLDFFQALRQRPVWDIVVVPLILGVSLLCLIGFLLGGRRLARNMRLARRD